MKWKKVGKIFDPTKYELPLGCTFYAQSPQTLVFPDFVRIYFSTRSVDEQGRFLSQIAFVDMDKTFQKVIRLSSKPVIPLGARGSFDEHGIFPLHIFNDGANIYGFISGLSRRISVTVESSIGISESYDNGETFIRLGKGPVLTSSVREPFLVCDPFVKKLDGTYHMWYIFGTKWIKESEEKKPDRVYKIGHARSTDLVNWDKEGREIIPNTIDENECQALPTVIEMEGVYHMIFCYRHVFGFRSDKTKGYRLGYAHSTDLVNWIRDDDRLGITISDSDWDSDMMCYPHLFKVDKKVYLLYNGNEFGKFGFGIAELIN